MKQWEKSIDRTRRHANEGERAGTLDSWRRQQEFAGGSEYDFKSEWGLLNLVRRGLLNLVRRKAM